MFLADISFECPNCAGPLIAEASYAGRTSECPHCYGAFEVPEAAAINKNVFQEPIGLRRILQEVHDQEWEKMRRELKALRARNAELESTVNAAPIVSPEGGAALEAECEALRAALEAVRLQYEQASRDLAASREAHGVTLYTLRIERDQSHAEITSLRSAAEELRRSVHDLEERLQVEQAKVFLMEAANGGDQLLHAGFHSAPSAEHDALLINELQIQIAELRESNYSLQESRDGANEELARLRESTRMPAEGCLNVTLGTLHSTIPETLHLYRERPTAGAS